MNIEELVQTAFEQGYKEGVIDARDNKVRYRPNSNAEMIEKIIEVVTGYYKIPISLIRGKSRRQPVVFARHTCMVMAKSFTQLSLRQIGLEFGRTDHTTTMYAIQAVQDLCDTNETIKKEIEYVYGVLTDVLVSNLPADIVPKELTAAVRRLIRHSEIPDIKKVYPPKAKILTMDIQEPKVIERPPAIYSNRGHAQILTEYSS